MFNIFSGWTRMAALGCELATTGWKTAEAIVASGTVIDRRSRLVMAAARNPAAGDWQELSRMFPEKLAAFSRASGAITSEMMAMQTAFMAEAHFLGTMSAAGLPPSCASLQRLTQRNFSYVLGTAERISAAGTNALAPVHRTVTANARRLKRRKA